MHRDITETLRPWSRPGSARWIFSILAAVISCAAAATRAKAPDASRSPSALPQFSVPGGIYTDKVAVKLTANSPKAVVRYTLDGSEPTVQSPQFKDVIEISESTLLKARVFDAQSSSNAIVSQTYLLA